MPRPDDRPPQTLKITVTLTGPVTVYPPPDGMGNPDGCGEYWEGWPSKIPNKHALALYESILKAENLIRFSIINRWLLNRQKPGPRILKLEYSRSVNFKNGQTATHYYARRCVRCIQAGKKAAERGNLDAALRFWSDAETAAERLYGSWLHTLAAKEASRVRGVKRYNESETCEMRAKVKKLILSLPENARYERSLTAIVSKRTGLSKTQSRVHISALGYGAKNKKHGA